VNVKTDGAKTKRRGIEALIVYTQRQRVACHFAGECGGQKSKHAPMQDHRDIL
jgi:hypothetical protein